MHLCNSLQILFKCPTPAIVFGNATKSSRFAHFWQGAQSLAPATQSDASTSKSGANMWRFVHFDFEMCFAPQRPTIFEHLNFQKCSEPVSFLHFWFRNVLRATTACKFSSLIWPAGSAPAALASLLFDPPEPQIIGKTQCFATFLPFRAPGSSFFWDFLFFDLLSSSLLFSDSSHLCFSSVHIVGSLTSKLPSIRILDLQPVYKQEGTQHHTAIHSNWCCKILVHATSHFYLLLASAHMTHDFGFSKLCTV